MNKINRENSKKEKIQNKKMFNDKIKLGINQIISESSNIDTNINKIIKIDSFPSSSLLCLKIEYSHDKLLIDKLEIIKNKVNKKKRSYL
jgi:hypothetical protein